MTVSRRAARSQNLQRGRNGDFRASNRGIRVVSGVRLKTPGLCQGWAHAVAKLTRWSGGLTALRIATGRQSLSWGLSWSGVSQLERLHQRSRSDAKRDYRGNPSFRAHQVLIRRAS